MQHIKSIMTKVDAIINGTAKKTATDTGNDKMLRVIASYVKGIREAREGLKNGK